MLRFDFATLLMQDATYTRNAYNVQSIQSIYYIT